MTEPDGWQEWGKHVLKELERLNKNFESLQESNESFKLWTNGQIAALNVKAGIWGLIGGLIPVIILMVYKGGK